MATAIRQIELSSAVQPIAGLSGYQRCMLVFRWRGRVVGRTVVNVGEDRVESDAIVQAAHTCAGKATLRAWLEDAIGYDERRVTRPPELRATVAICTRERPEDLARAVAGVVNLAPAPAEVLVVDNAPASGATRAVVDRFPAVRYVLEPRRGLNAARNRALAEARGDIVAFTDDDAVPEEGWLSALLLNFGDPRVVCATGITLPLELETPAQELFEEHGSFVKGFVRRVFDGQIDNPLAVGSVGAGANMAVRRGIVESIGAFDERLDGGMPTRSGGDHEMFIRMLLAGHRIVYDPAAVSWHRHRRELAEVHDTMYGYGVGVWAMFTGMLIERRELGVLKLAWAWFRGAHLPVLFGRGGQGPAAALARAEFRGCLHGPAAWLRANRLRPAPTR